MQNVDSARHLGGVKLPTIVIADPFKVLFVCLILSSVYEKSGIMVDLGGRDISISIYKLLFIILVTFYAVDPFKQSSKVMVEFDRKLYRLLMTFVVVETIASLLGSFVTSGSIRLSSEIYYLIQRSMFLFIPLFGLRYNMPPKTILKVFMGAVLIHDFFIGLQFIVPGVYASFVEYVFDPLRQDNVFKWDGKSLNFYGLQRTSNYGTFVAAFGLLILGFKPTWSSGRILAQSVAILSILITILGPSRSVFVMVMIALLLFCWRTRAFSNVSALLVLFGLATILLLLFLLGLLRFEHFSSLYAFFDPEREGSNIGKLMIAQYGLQLFVQSPIVGWGQQRFADISAPLGNTLYYTSETHSHLLSIILSSGLIGLIAYLAVFLGIAKKLWQRKDRDYVVMCAMFIGLGVYSIIYDAGALDMFACFTGIAAYYALYMPKSG